MPRTKLAAAAEAELNDLERVWSQLDLPGHRVELIDGQIVVSPSASRRHSVAIDQLIKQPRSQGIVATPDPRPDDRARRRRSL